MPRVEASTVPIVILVEPLGLVRLVDRDVGLRHRGAAEVAVADRLAPDVLVFHGALTGVTRIHQGFVPSDVLPIKRRGERWQVCSRSRALLHCTVW